jgi:hypothetical protein
MHSHTVVSSGWEFEAAKKLSPVRTELLRSQVDLRGLKDVKYATLCMPCEHDVMSEICVYLPRYVSSKRNSAAFNGIARLEDELI